MRVAVVGHVEWVELVRVDHVPRLGEIVHADPWWEGPAGGGPGAAVQLMKLAGEATLFTALGDDELGHRAKKELGALGLRVEAAWREEPTRRAFTHIDATGERTITVIGDRLAPKLNDDLPWEELSKSDAVYVTAGDRGALTQARAARLMVATTRILADLKAAHLSLDALVGSRRDPGEVFKEGDLDPSPKLVVLTDGAEGGSFRRDKDWLAFQAPALKDPVVDRYGAGDAFAAALTFGLASGMDDERAVALAARCGASVLTGRGPYEGQLKLA